MPHGLCSSPVPFWHSYQSTLVAFLGMENLRLSKAELQSGGLIYSSHSHTNTCFHEYLDADRESTLSRVLQPFIVCPDIEDDQQAVSSLSGICCFQRMEISAATCLLVLMNQ